MSKRPGILSVVLPVLAVIAGSACSTSPVPLSDPPSVPVDTTLFGLWEARDPEASPPYDRMLVLPFDGFQYYVEYYGTESQGEIRIPADTSRYRVFLTEVERRSIANIRCMECTADPEGWLFLFVDREGDRLALTPVADEVYSDLKDVRTAEEARLAFGRALARGFEAEDPSVFTRLPWSPKSWEK